MQAIVEKDGVLKTLLLGIPFCWLTARAGQLEAGGN